MGFRTFRDRLALVVLVAILLLWAVVFAMYWQGRITDGQMPVAVSMVLAATISQFEKVMNFFFRKTGPPEPPTP